MEAKIYRCFGQEMVNEFKKFMGLSNANIMLIICIFILKGFSVSGCDNSWWQFRQCIF